MMNQEERGAALAAANQTAVPVDLGLGPVAMLELDLGASGRLAAGAVAPPEKNGQSTVGLASLALPGLPSVEEVLSSADTSFWLREALIGALARDPVDAAADSALLAALLGRNMDSILSR